MSRFINGQWMSETEFRQWRIEHGYEKYINFEEVLQRLPRLSAKKLDFALHQVQANINHPAFNGPDADSEEQLRQCTLLDMLHLERGYRLFLSAFTSAPDCASKE